MFYTPLGLARLLVERTLRPRLESCARAEDVLALRVIDPAAGSGFFLLESLRVLAAAVCNFRGDVSQKATRCAMMEVARHCLHGVDKDATAAELTRALIWLEVCDTSFSAECLDQSIKYGDAIYSSGVGRNIAPDSFTRDPAEKPEFDWKNEFPHIFATENGTPPGFDILVSNPPWGKIKPDLKEFCAHLDARARQFQGSDLRRFVFQDKRFGESQIESIWGAYQLSVREYASTLRHHPLYVHQKATVDGKLTGGDADLYKYFVELAFAITKPDGRLGFILPSSFHRSEGATGLRRLYMGAGGFDTYLEFENRKRLFPIHSMFRFVVATYGKELPKGFFNAAFRLTEVETAALYVSEPAKHCLDFDLEFLSSISGELLTVPEVQTKEEQALYRKLHMAHPPLGKRQPDTWNVTFVRELDMTNDSDAFCSADDLTRLGHRKADGCRFVSRAGKNFLPLYEGRMVHQFNSAAKAYVRGHGRSAVWTSSRSPNGAVVPHYFVPEDYVRGIENLWSVPRAGYCDVTGHANERTVLAAIIPPHAVCGNKVPTCLFDSPDSDLHYLWLAIANSFVVEWHIRRRISTTLNFFHWYSTPFPRVAADSPVGKPLIAGAKTLSFPESHPAFIADPWERARIRSRLDATVASLFGLSAAEFALILSDFNSLDRRQPALSSPSVGGRSYTEKRSTVTRDLVLLSFCEQNGVPTNPDTAWTRDAKLTNLQERVDLALSSGAVPYSTSECRSEA